MLKLISAFFGATILLAFYFTFNPLETKTATINDTILEVEIAEKMIQQQKGLSGRKELEENKGMLFVYEEPHIPSFWMKDMNFPIDIIWINEDNKIIGIEKNVNPDTYPQTFTPPDPVLSVLEVNAGWSDAYNIEIGDSININ